MLAYSDFLCTAMMNNGISAISPLEGLSRPRRRLPASDRISQILDAALQVFSDKGFASARLDDIARAAGMSKGGIYTHFVSKEQIFAALLKCLIKPVLLPPESKDCEEPVTVDLVIQRLIDPMYETLMEPKALLAVRLLLADGMHAPEVFIQWQRTMFDPHLANVTSLIQRGVQQGTLRPSVATMAPRLIMSPSMHAMFESLVHGRADPEGIHEWKRLHVAVVRELLTP